MSKSKTQIFNLGVKYRGNILAACCILEKEIEYFIIKSFTDDADKGHILWVTMLDRFHFDGKISVFEMILKLSKKDLFKKEFGKLFSELRYVKDERNKFAHYVQLIKDEPTELVTLLKFRDSVQSINYSPEDYRKLLEKIELNITNVRKLVKNVHMFFPAQ